jgi:hypothetical protein
MLMIVIQKLHPNDFLSFIGIVFIVTILIFLLNVFFDLSDN